MYHIQSHLIIFCTSATPDFKYQWVEADGAWSGFIHSAPRTTAVSSFGLDDISGASTIALQASSIPEYAQFEALVTAGVAGGIFKLQWA